jgi:hypothetical protein
MYGPLWNILPGPTWVRVVTLVAASALLLLVLFEWVFPWVTAILPFQEQTVE